MKQNIIFGLGGMALGATVGAILGYIYAKKHNNPEPVKEQENEEPQYVHLEYYDKKIAEENKNTEEEKTDYVNYSKAESEHPLDEEEEEEYQEMLRASEEREKYRKEHEGKIEMMKQEDWDSDFPEEDYEHEELWYFPETGELADEDGALLEPLDKYVSNIFTRIGWDTNNDESICIRNHILEKDFKIWKQPMITREEFFHY